MPRYFLKLAYRGTPFVGWQSQQNGLAVQQCLEETMTKVIGNPIAIVGCGRTDAGVHASAYYAHFDLDSNFGPELLNRINRVLPPEIALIDYRLVDGQAHARHAAHRRTYHYYLSRTKNPFRKDLEYAYYGFDNLDIQKMRAAATLIAEYEEFFPFCKSNSGVDHYLCRIYESQWHIDDHALIYEIAGNRFLRGIVRLIVGMCMLVGLGKINLLAVKKALDTQTPLDKSLSAPAHGLYLSGVEYPEKLNF